MASSNRHWPSMFKSKPTCNTRHHHQWHSNDSNTLLSSASPCHRSPYTSGCEERSPEPKPRWNPKPEQIRILESIFNSGMVNPPREEIRKIRAQLQEYGQVGDANVFYWFQNRKSRSKHKTRHLQKSQNHQSPTTTKVTTPSSSSSSEKSYSKSIDFLLNSPTASVNQHFGGGGVGGGFHHHLTEFSQEQPFCFPAIQQPHPPPTDAVATTTAGFTEGFCFSEFGNVVSQGHNQGNVIEAVGSGSGMLLTDLLMMNQQSVIQKMNDSKCVDEKTVKVSSYNFTAPLPPTSALPSNPTTTTVASTICDIQGVVEPMPAGKSTVFINDVAFEVAVGPFNVREAFGDDAVLIHSYGQPVVTNEWGVTLQSLQHGAFYYLVRSFSYGQSSTIDLVHIFFSFLKRSHFPTKVFKTNPENTYKCPS
ncbi:putative transcription factor homeobox-WOX family [Helianthus annuus]|nr:putative transcription factor homeobox-WOX family [Helianthus annuus]